MRVGHGKGVCEGDKMGVGRVRCGVGDCGDKDEGSEDEAEG